MIDTNESVVITTTPINSIVPSVQECEKFAQFLNAKFGLNLPLNIIFTIEQKSPKLYGYFMPSEHAQNYQKDTLKLNAITLNSLHLKDGHAYLTIAHEVAHFYNNSLGVQDCSSNQYHNKHFKKVAEMLGLLVSKTNKGYAKTDTTPEFEKTLQEFKPTPDAFAIFQNNSNKPKSKSRLDKYKCSCDIIIYASASFLGGVCSSCDTEFKKQEKDGDTDGDTEKDTDGNTANCCLNNEIPLNSNLSIKHKLGVIK